MLWTAPELLRMKPECRPRNGTKEGDIYSVGVILQEIVYRCMPYGSDMHPKGTAKTKMSTFCIESCTLRVQEKF